MVVAAELRGAIRDHALAERPNESCGLLLLDGDQAVRYVRGTNVSPSPYRFELFIEPLEWAGFGDSGLTQAVVHSHISAPAYPSRTDVENIGLWRKSPYVIYSIAKDDLAAFEIDEGGRIARLPLT
ncbi:MAG TPA: Mov34/MPN/PAD-1 family protein [Gaiellaceae bacterium]|nr:Mov34/MPN/PAD-1 family protein [Gaiellaceae bacterium]